MGRLRSELNELAQAARSLTSDSSNSSNSSNSSASAGAAKETRTGSGEELPTLSRLAKTSRKKTSRRQKAPKGVLLAELEARTESPQKESGKGAETSVAETHENPATVGTQTVVAKPASPTTEIEQVRDLLLGNELGGLRTRMNALETLCEKQAGVIADLTAALDELKEDCVGLIDHFNAESQERRAVRDIQDDKLSALETSISDLEGRLDEVNTDTTGQAALAHALRTAAATLEPEDS